MVVDFSYSSYDHPQLQDQDQEQEEEEEDDYIDMEVSSYYSNFLKSSPIHQPNEFEFMTQSGPLDQAHLSTTSPADELFYKGKLLPLHLPPRLQIMESLLLHHHYHTPLSTNAANTPASGTPFLSCNASPVESCHVSRELNPDEYFLECSNGSKKSGWSRKLKLIKHIRGASKAYLKYLFGKSSTTDESSFMAAKSKDEKGSNSNSKRSTFGETKVPKTKIDAKVCHRRSFSGAFKLLTSSSSSGSSSSSTSSNSNASSDAQLFNRNSSANSELESAVAGAIAHCKQSQTQVVRSRKTLSEIGLYNSRFEASEE